MTEKSNFVIKEVMPGADGRVPSDTVRADTGELTRTVAKLIRLDLASGIF